jgi:hypothetical protein
MSFAGSLELNKAIKSKGQRHRLQKKGRDRLDYGSIWRLQNQAQIKQYQG